MEDLRKTVYLVHLQSSYSNLNVIQAAQKHFQISHSQQPRILVLNAINHVPVAMEV
jgi:hypothetical protein